MVLVNLANGQTKKLNPQNSGDRFLFKSFVSMNMIRGLSFIDLNGKRVDYLFRHTNIDDISIHNLIQGNAIKGEQIIVRSKHFDIFIKMYYSDNRVVIDVRDK